MDLKALHRGEVIAVFGGLLLAISVFLPWYTLGNGFTTLGSCRGPNTTCTGWESLPVLRYLLLLGAIAPLILAYIVVRGYALAWPRGEMTAVVAVIAIVLILFVGVIDRPGQPSGEIGLTWGWFVALIGSLLMVTGSAWRARESAPRRNPPGVL
jgi:hypothetical protein